MENPLKGLFRQMTDKNEEKMEFEMPAQIKNAVFSTLDTTSLVADIIDLFTVRFVQAQAEVLDAIPQSPYPNQTERLFDYHQENHEKTESASDNSTKNEETVEK